MIKSTEITDDFLKVGQKWKLVSPGNHKPTNGESYRLVENELHQFLIKRDGRALGWMDSTESMTVRDVFGPQSDYYFELVEDVIVNEQETLLEELRKSVAYFEKRIAEIEAAKKPKHEPKAGDFWKVEDGEIRFYQFFSDGTARRVDTDGYLGAAYCGNQLTIHTEPEKWSLLFNLLELLK